MLSFFITVFIRVSSEEMFCRREAFLSVQSLAVFSLSFAERYSVVNFRRPSQSCSKFCPLVLLLCDSCAAEAPCSVNTASFPESSFIISPLTTTLPSYFSNVFSYSEFCDDTNPLMLQNELSLPSKLIASAILSTPHREQPSPQRKLSLFLKKKSMCAPCGCATWNRDFDPRCGPGECLWFEFFAIL